MAKIVITGGKGFVGSHLRKLLPEAQSYDLKDGQDILDYTKLQQALTGQEIVIHLAALISVNDSLKHPGKYYSTNVAGTDNILRAAVSSGCKTVIFASSAAVYAPDNPYGLSKKIGEDLMNEYKSKIQTISTRFFNIYGPGQNPEYAGVISKFFEFAKKRKTLKVTGTGEQTRDFISVSDITSIIKIISKNRQKIPSGSIFEVGKGAVITINDLAKMFADKYHLALKHSSDEPTGIVHSKANNTSLLQTIGNYKFMSLPDGLNELAPFMGLFTGNEARG